MLCWLCTLSYRRALAKTKHSERNHSSSTSSKAKEQQQQHSSSGHHHHHHNKRPQRPDVTKVLALDLQTSYVNMDDSNLHSY